MCEEGRQPRTSLAPAIRRAPLQKLTIFDVTEAELEELERGTRVSLFLNLAIFVLSTAVSFSISLATAKIESDRTFTVFVVITVVGYLAGLTFTLLWLFTRKSIKSVTQEIRKRLPPEGVPASSVAAAEFEGT